MCKKGSALESVEMGRPREPRPQGCKAVSLSHNSEPLLASQRQIATVRLLLLNSRGTITRFANSSGNVRTVGSGHSGNPQTGYSGPSPARGPACPAPLLRSLTPSFSLTSADTAASNARRSESELVKVFKSRWSVHKRKSGAQSATSSKLEHQLPARQSWGYARPIRADM